MLFVYMMMPKIMNDDKKSAYDNYYNIYKSTLSYSE